MYDRGIYCGWWPGIISLIAQLAFGKYHTFVLAVEAGYSQICCLHSGARRSAWLVTAVWTIAIVIVDLR